jgi:hypothetical protein
MPEGEDLDPTLDELSGPLSLEMLQRLPEPISFNLAIPIEPSTSSSPTSATLDLQPVTVGPGVLR